MHTIFPEAYTVACKINIHTRKTIEISNKSRILHFNVNSTTFDIKEMRNNPMIIVKRELAPYGKIHKN